MNDLVVRTGEMEERARATAQGARAANTRRAYGAAWRHFEGFCDSLRRSSLPADPETVALYVSECGAAGMSASTIDVRLAAISRAHYVAGMVSPRKHVLVSEMRSGVRRGGGEGTRGRGGDTATRRLGEGTRGKRAVTVGDLAEALTPRPPLPKMGEGESSQGVREVRDRAILLLGFAGAFRRSEIVGLRVGDIEFVEEGMVVTVRGGKTDQEGKGREVGIAKGTVLCAVEALRAWMALLPRDGGAPLFRRVRGARIGENALTDQVVGDVVKDYVGRAGLDPALYGGHSLRAGLVTAAANAGLPIYDIMAQTGHRSERTVRGYIRRASLFEGNVSGKVGM